MTVLSGNKIDYSIVSSHLVYNVPALMMLRKLGFF